MQLENLFLEKENKKVHAKFETLALENL